jgi:hypothetical protein
LTQGAGCEEEEQNTVYSGKRDVADLHPDAVGDGVGAREGDRQVVGLLMSRLRRMAVMIDQLSLARQSRNVEAMQLDAASHAVHWAIIELEGLECNAKIEPAWRAPVSGDRNATRWDPSRLGCQRH